MPAHSRCPWAEASEAYRRYHDTEWGVPVHDDHVFFEFLVLECAQAGLAWSTILAKRPGYAAAFAQFDPERVARFTARTIDSLVANPDIVRHRGKIQSTVSNARAFLDVQHAFGSFDAYVWAFIGGSPRSNRFTTLDEVPATTAESDALSRDLKQRGFRFVGSTIVYAFMQATGLVNDHLLSCPRWPTLSGATAPQPGADRR